MFLAVGIFLCVLGTECLVVDKFVMAGEQPPSEAEIGAAQASPATLFGASAPTPPSKREIEPAEWAPWSLLSAGAVVILYSLTLARPG